MFNTGGEITTITYPVTYMVTVTDSGDWYYAASNDFLFTYIKNSWSDKLKSEVSAAFKETLNISEMIKDAVKATSGQVVVDGLYLQNEASMAKAMNSIHGMGQTRRKPEKQSGEGSAESINEQFFTAVLDGLGDKVSPIEDYLDTAMAKIQTQIKKNTATDNFGTVIGLVSAVPELDIIMTTFQYAFSSAKTAESITKFKCGSNEIYSYDYTYTVTSYNYSKPNDSTGNPVINSAS
jgi:hypothetical protein